MKLDPSETEVNQEGWSHMLNVKADFIDIWGNQLIRYKLKLNIQRKQMKKWSTCSKWLIQDTWWVPADAQYFIMFGENHKSAEERVLPQIWVRVIDLG